MWFCMRLNNTCWHILKDTPKTIASHTILVHNALLWSVYEPNTLKLFCFWPELLHNHMRNHRNHGPKTIVFDSSPWPLKLPFRWLLTSIFAKPHEKSHRLWTKNLNLARSLPQGGFFNWPHQNVAMFSIKTRYP